MKTFLPALDMVVLVVFTGGEGESKLECPGLCLFQLVDDMWYRNECRAGRVLGTTTTDDTRSYGLI